MEKNPEGDLWEILNTIADNDYEGVIYVDSGGIVKFISQGYADFLNINRDDVLGRYINDVAPQSSLMEVMRTGRPQYGDVWEINGQHRAGTPLAHIQGRQGGGLPG